FGPGGGRSTGCLARDGQEIPCARARAVPEPQGTRHTPRAMRSVPSSNKPHPAIIAEASAWFVEFRADDVSGEARARFIDWLRRSPEHIQAYLEVSGTWSELPTADPERKLDLSALIARARDEPDIVALAQARPLVDTARPRDS